MRKIRSKSHEEAGSQYISPAFLILPEEKIIFKTHPHWLFVVVPEICLATLGIVVSNYLPLLLSDQIGLQKLILVLFGVAWSFVMIVIFLDWLCTNYYLTNCKHRVG